MKSKIEVVVNTFTLQMNIPPHYHYRLSPPNQSPKPSSTIINHFIVRTASLNSK